MSDNGTNGNGKRLPWWIVSVLTGLVVGLGSNHLTRSERHGRDITALQTQATATDYRLQRIEDKLDQLLRNQKP